MLESGREHPAMTGLHESMTAIAVAGAMPWLLSALSRIPGATGGYDRFTSWCSQQLEAKKKVRDYSPVPLQLKLTCRRSCPRTWGASPGTSSPG